MSVKKNHYFQAIHILQELHKEFPMYNMGRHLSTALEGYGDMWGITDKELVYALEKYKEQIEMDVPHTEESEIDRIIKEGMDLGLLFRGEEYEEET
jgi:hypothetical protein